MPRRQVQSRPGQLEHFWLHRVLDRKCNEQRRHQCLPIVRSWLLSRGLGPDSLRTMHSGLPLPHGFKPTSALPRRHTCQPNSPTGAGLPLKPRSVRSLWGTAPSVPLAVRRQYPAQLVPSTINRCSPLASNAPLAASKVTMGKLLARHVRLDTTAKKAPQRRFLARTLCPLEPEATLWLLGA